mmetsp:Transcript_4445/g.4919  ORF Transcript_4445/g.4919 Transcript_4445/m.4919 type:complete len:96 (+) Transcript_4445:312-599(+)
MSKKKLARKDTNNELLALVKRCSNQAPPPLEKKCLCTPTLNPNYVVNAFGEYDVGHRIHMSNPGFQTLNESFLHLTLKPYTNEPNIYSKSECLMI